MTERRPLVIIGGQIQQLPSGDTTAGASGTGGSAVAKFAIVGGLTVNIGTARWYPDHNITISKVYFSLGTVPSSSVEIDVKKNGVSIFGGSRPICGAGSNRSTDVALSVAVTPSDYLTVDVVSASGADATICIVH